MDSTNQIVYIFYPMVGFSLLEAADQGPDWRACKSWEAQTKFWGPDQGLTNGKHA